MKTNPAVVTFNLVALAAFLSLPARALGDGEIRASSRPRVVAESKIGKPIGSIESIGAIKVNGKTVAGGKEPVWRDDLIQLPQGLSASVNISSFGQVNLDAGTTVKFSTQQSQADLRVRAKLLVNLVSGSVTIRLEPGMPALLNAQGASFIASPGSSVSFGVREDRAFAKALTGAVMDIGNWRIVPPPLLTKVATRFNLKPVAASGFIKPIGAVESIGAIKINGKTAPDGKGLIWGGDLIQLPQGFNAQVVIGSFGQITLQGGAEVKFSTRNHQSETHSTQTLLVELTDGSVTLKLDPRTSAYLSARGAFFTALPGASLRFGVREDRAFAEALSGVVTEFGSWAVTPPPPVMLAAASFVRLKAQDAQRRYLITPMQAMYDVKARSTRQVQVRVEDDDKKRVPNLPIIFSLGGNIGSLSSTTALTNSQGIATVQFTAAAQPMRGSITAQVQGTQFSTTMQIAVLKAVPGFWAPQNAIPVFSALGTAAAIGAVEVINKEEPLKVKAVGAPTIKP